MGCGLGVFSRFLEESGHLFRPLDILFGTKFGPKHHIMAQMAMLYRHRLNIFLKFWDP